MNLGKQLARRTGGRGTALVFSAGMFGAASSDDQQEVPHHKSEFDVVNKTKQREDNAVKYADRSSLDWRERLSLMWRVEEYEEMSPELNLVYQSSMTATLVGGMAGAYHESKKMTQIFLEKNKHEMFRHPREAQASLQDRMIIAYFKGFTKLGSRMLLLSFTYTAVAQSMACIRNYVNPLDHMLAGATMGAIYRFNMGPKGMVGGGVLGSLLGLQGGLVFWLLQYITGETVEERWRREYVHHQNLIRARDEAAASADPRQEIIKKDEPATLTPFDQEEDKSWLRATVIKIRLWAIENGFMHQHDLPNEYSDKRKP